jgi:hypothetical protein
MNPSHYLAGAVLLAASAMAPAAQVVEFAAGRASVTLPDSVRVEVKGDEVLATFGAHGDHTVEITLLAMLNTEGTPNAALEFVKQQAGKRGAKLLSDGERSTFSEPGTKTIRGGKSYQAMHWQIGVGDCVFTMTLSAPLPLSRELDEFLGAPLNTIVNELTCTTPKLTPGRIQPDPAVACTGFKPHHLCFELPRDGVARDEYSSQSFYAVILETRERCAFTEQGRAVVQALFPRSKVFHESFQCGDDVEDSVRYTNVNEKFGFLAVYAGATVQEANARLEEVQATGKFPGANIRRMQAVFVFP